MKAVYIVEPVRTPIGTFGGTLKNTPAVELGAVAIKETIKRSQIPIDKIQAVIMGQVIQAGSKMNPARQAAIHAGVPVSVPAMTVNRVCGSGAQAIVSGFLEILAGYADVIIAGGMENMDLAPYLLPGGRYGHRMGEAKIYDSMLYDGLNDAFSGNHSGWHTEDLVKKYGITREEQDQWAFRSQREFAKAQESGFFDSEIVPVSIQTKKGEELFKKDEHNRPDTTLEGLAKLKPAFRENGTITAGNAPGLNSGASAMLLCSEKAIHELKLKPILKIVSYGIGAVEPGYFGIGPVPAVKVALERAGWKLEEVDSMEVNEAFAAIAIAIINELGFPKEKTNPEGGAIAHGHPIGATGAILTTRLAYYLKRKNLTKGIVTMCIGGGQGIALCLEKSL